MVGISVSGSAWAGEAAEANVPNDREVNMTSYKMPIAWGLFPVSMALAACGGPLEDVVPKPLNPDATFRVEPAELEIMPDNKGTPWDPDGSPPDVRLRLSCPGGKEVTSDVVESVTPQWAQEGLFCESSVRDLMDPGFEITLEDMDPNAADPIATLVNPVSMKDLMDGEFNLGEKDGLKSFKFNLVPK